MSRYMDLIRRIDPRAGRGEEQAPTGNPPAPDHTLPPGYGDPADWPPECLASLRLYHRPPVLDAPHALLWPLVGKRVQTPRGPGRLLQVFASLAAVVLDGAERTAVFEPAEIRPLERGT